MSVRRGIKYASTCDAAAELLGGYQKIDDSLTVGICDALSRNPYGFEQIESDWFSARLIKTKSFEDTPALVWLFVIDDKKDIILTHVELFQSY